MNFYTRTSLANSRGAALIEILIALSIMGVITMSIFKTYIVQHTNYITQDDITTIQQNVRAAIDEMGRHVRMAGYGVPDDALSIIASNTNPDTITISFNTSGCKTFLSEPMPMPSSELKCGSDPSCLDTGQLIFIYEPDVGIGEWFELTAVQSSWHLQHNKTVLSRIYGANSVVVAMRQAKFFIDNTTDPDHPKLMVQPHDMAPLIYADDIVDLQFTYRMKNGSVEDEPVLPGNIREVSILVTGRSHNPNPEDKDNPYRYRTVNTSVNLRNMGS